MLPGETISPAGGQACTINHEPTAAYCAYHNYSASSAVWANMDSPVYASPVGYRCGSDARWTAIQSSNGNPDADTEISPTSHEVSESITDPDTETGWLDSSGNEIGDDCAYIYSRPRGAPGAYANQAINGPSFLTRGGVQQQRVRSIRRDSRCVQSASSE